MQQNELALQSKKSLSKNTFYTVLNECASLVFPLIYSAYIARVIGAEGIGRVAFAVTVVSYFLFIASFSIPVYGIREIARCGEDAEGRSRIFSELFWLQFIFTSASLVLFYLIVFFAAHSKSGFLLYALSSVPIFMNYFNADYLLKGCEEFKYLVIRNVLSKVIFTVLLFIFVHGSNDLYIYAFLFACSTGVMHLFNVFCAKKLVRLTFCGINILRHIKPLCVLFASETLGTLYNKLDIFMLGLLCASEYTAYYDYAHKIISICITVCIAFTSAFLPRLSTLYQADKKSFYALAAEGERLLFFISVPLSCGLYLLAPQIVLLLFGNGFEHSVTAIRIFSPLVCVRSVCDLLCWQCILASSKEKIRIPATLLASFVNAALNLALIPRMFHNGAAIASLFTELSVNFFLLIYVLRFLRIKLEYKAFVDSVLTSAVMCLAITALKRIESGTLITLLTCTAAGFALYMILNVLLKNQIALLLFSKACRCLRSRN